MQTEEKVILVDAFDNEVGSADKMKTHVEGKLHRAFSVFLFNSDGEMLLQQRARHKYHSGGLWSNACCGHPRPGEETISAAVRRLSEELGITCSLRKIFDLHYKEKVNATMLEHEFDHVFFGHFHGELFPNPDEVMAVKWIGTMKLQKHLKEHAEQYTPWFKLLISRVLDEIHSDTKQA